MILSLLSECIGTFIFFSIVLSSGKPLEVAVGLLSMLYIFGNISGGHFNPGISVMYHIKGDMPFKKCISYILSQIIGMILAIIWYKNVKKITK